MNIKQQTTSEVSNIETVMAGNEGIDTPPPKDISNVFAAADLSSQSSYDTVKYKRAWHRAKGIRSYIFYLQGKLQTHRVEHCPLH